MYLDPQHCLIIITVIVIYVQLRCLGSILVQVASAKLSREEKEPVKQKVAKPSYNQDLPGNYLLVVYSMVQG